MGATSNLDAPLPEVSHSFQTIRVPETIPSGPALLAIREYAPPGVEVLVPLSLQIVTRVRLIPASRAVAEVLLTRRTFEWLALPSIVLLMVLMMVLTTVGLRHWDPVAALVACCLVSQVLVNLLSTVIGVDRMGWTLIALAGTTVAPTVLGAMALTSGLRLPRAPVLAWLLAHLTVRAWATTDLLRADPVAWTPILGMFYLAQLVVNLGIAVWIAVIAWRKPGAPRILLIAGLLVLSASLMGRAASRGGLPILGVRYNWDRLSNVAFAVAAGSWVVRRERARRAEELRLKGEMEAAKGVQTLLLGQRLPEGVEAVYLPAGEVGGDFYQAFDTPGGKLILVGDVSGKGSSAAMTAAAITGAVRLLRHQGPARILTELNSVAGSPSGFITCCCVLVEADGLRAATAGHPAPYADGRELELPAGLPLGMVAGVEYEEARFPLPRVLTLVSDGVVEAASPVGELFGFDRTREISTTSAHEIAEAAKAWGQNDDITVVTVRRGTARDAAYGRRKPSS